MQVVLEHAGKFFDKAKASVRADRDYAGVQEPDAPLLEVPVSSDQQFGPGLLTGFCGATEVSVACGAGLGIEVGLWKPNPLRLTP